MVSRGSMWFPPLRVAPAALQNSSICRPEEEFSTVAGAKQTSRREAATSGFDRISGRSVDIAETTQMTRTVLRRPKTYFIRPDRTSSNC